MSKQAYALGMVNFPRFDGVPARWEPRHVRSSFNNRDSVPRLSLCQFNFLCFHPSLPLFRICGADGSLLPFVKVSWPSVPSGMRQGDGFRMEMMGPVPPSLCQGELVCNVGALAAVGYVPPSVLPLSPSFLLPTKRERLRPPLVGDPLPFPAWFPHVQSFSFCAEKLWG